MQISSKRGPAPGFRLLRYFTVASLAAFLPVAAALLCFEPNECTFVRQAHQEQSGLVSQMQGRLVQRHDAAAPAFLLGVYEATNLNLARLFANALWEKDFAPFVAKVQHLPIDRCRAIAESADGDGKAAPTLGQRACAAAIGRQIMALPGFRALDARVIETMKRSSIHRIKAFDLHGITVYSSEHGQIGEDHSASAGWRSATAGKPASELMCGRTFAGGSMAKCTA